MSAFPKNQSPIPGASILMVASTQAVRLWEPPTLVPPSWDSKCTSSCNQTCVPVKSFGIPAGAANEEITYSG
jgi:hypothetical protein